MRKGKTFVTKLLSAVTLACCAFGAWLALPAMGKSEMVAKAETVEIQDTLTIEYWSSASGVNDSYFVIKAQGDYTIADSALLCYWNDHAATADLNNGCDLMEYIYVDGESTRSIVTKNATDRTYGKEGDTFPFSMNGVYAPVAVETAGAGSSGLNVRVLSDYKENFSITVKEGFTLKLASGDTVVLSSDITYKFEDKILTKVYVAPEVDKVDATSKIGVENRSNWAPEQNPDHLYFALTYTDGDNGWLNVADEKLVGYWNDHLEKADSNYGVDIMQYLYINDKSTREIVMANKNGATSYVGETFPFSVGSWYAPVTVESTGGSGLLLKIMNDYVNDLGGTFTVTIKAGFTIKEAKGNVITATEDIVYNYDGSGLSRVQEYTLSFEGLTDTLTVTGGERIGSLPQIPAKDGYNAVGWTIDGVVITEDTIYTYSESKAATAQYSKIIEKVDVAATVEIESGYCQENQSQFAIKLTPASTLTSDAWWNINGETLIAANNGSDIMQYICINGQDLRTLSNNNRENNTYPVGDATGWLTNSDQCRPAFVETVTDGIFVTVLHAFSTKNYTITLKAGFELFNSDGKIDTLHEDVVFLYEAGAVTKIQEYTLTFAGLADVKTVKTGERIGKLPQVPALEGKKALGWAIDGVIISEETVWNYTADKQAQPLYEEEYTLSFEGLETTKTVKTGDAIGALPAVPEKEGYSVVGWTIDGAVINAETVFHYNADKTAVASYEAIVYTITIVRANGAEESISFTVEDKTEKLAEITLTAEDAKYTYAWSETLPETLELKNYTFTEIATAKPRPTQIISYSLSVGDGFAMNIYVGVLGDVVPVMQVTMDERVEWLDGTLVNEESNKYVYRVENITAAQLATEFSLRLVENEDEIDSMTYSVEAYLNALSKTEIGDELKTLIADIVAYGQAAEALAGVKDGIRTIDGLTVTAYSDLTDTDYQKSASLQVGVEITSVYLSTADGNRITVRFTATSSEGLVVKINGNEVEFAEVETGSSIYEVQAKPLHLLGCKDRYKITLTVGDTVVQTLIYSVKSYVYEKQNSAIEAEKSYLKALYNCSVSLQNYAEGV